MNNNNNNLHASIPDSHHHNNGEESNRLDSKSLALEISKLQQLYEEKLQAEQDTVNHKELAIAEIKKLHHELLVSKKEATKHNYNMLKEVEDYKQEIELKEQEIDRLEALIAIEKSSKENEVNSLKRKLEQNKYNHALQTKQFLSQISANEKEIAQMETVYQQHLQDMERRLKSQADVHANQLAKEKRNFEFELNNKQSIIETLATQLKNQVAEVEQLQNALNRERQNYMAVKNNQLTTNDQISEYTKKIRSLEDEVDRLKNH